MINIGVPTEDGFVDISEGSTWSPKNKNFCVYEVLHLANLHADDERKARYPVSIVYRGEDGRVWSKSPEAFVASFDRIYKKQ